MATKRVIHNSKLERIFSDFNPAKVIKKGSTSVIMEHPRYNTMVIVYTTDKAKVDWFEEIRNKVNFKFLEEKREGSVYDEVPKKIYKFQIKKMNPLDQKRKDYVNRHILSILSNKVTRDISPYLSDDETAQIRHIVKGFQPNMKFYKMAKSSKDKRVKDMMYRLKNFVETHRVETDLRLDSFMKLPNGDIVCTDPFFSTKET